MKGRNTRFPVLSLVLVLLFSACAVHAQVLTGTITGSVTDPQNLPIPKAKVTVVDLSTGQEYNSATDNQGNFTVTNLPYSFYRVTIEVQGFAKFTAGRVQVNVSQRSVLVAKLELAKAGTEIIVTGEQTPVQTETSEVKYSVDRRQIMNLSLATRNPMDLVKTLPGVVTPTSSGIGDAFVHGLRGNSTNITLDGINIADNFVKTSPFFGISSPVADSIGEFTVSTGAIGTDGGFGAAQVSIRTQRGQNELHGSVYWYQRTNAFNANTFLNNASRIARPFQLQNRIGAHVGGPAYFPKLYDGRNKSWWFFAYEAFRQPLSSARTRTVLGTDARKGLFTYTPTCGTTGQPACPSGVTAGQPITVDLLTRGTVQNGPASLNSAVMGFYNNLVPAPNTDQGCSGDNINIRCFAWNVPGRSQQDRYAVRGDHQITKNHSIEFAYNRQNFFSSPDFLNNVDNPFPKSSAGGQTSIREVFSWALHSTFGNTKTNEVRAGYQHAPVNFTFGEQFADTAGFQLDFPTVTDPIAQTARPQGRNTPVRQVTDNFTWIHGKHTLRVGGEYRQILANSFAGNVVIPRIALGSNTSNPNGLVQTAPGCTPSPTTTCQFLGGISSGDFARAQTVFNIVTGLLGSSREAFNHTSPTSGFVKGANAVQDPLQHNVAVYFQDSFKIWPRFTLEYGARWEYQGVFDYRNGLLLQPVEDVRGLFGPAGVDNFFRVLQTPLLADTLLDFAGGRNGKPLYDRDWNNVAPFLGFAWAPFKGGKTAIRGGITSHYTQDGFTIFTSTVGGSDGVFSDITKNDPVGVFSASNAAAQLPAVPVASFPVSQKQNFSASSSSQLFMLDAHIRTPYVIEWNFGVQRELPWRMTVEARYVGNHAVKQYRAWNINELNVLNNPFTCVNRAASGSTPALVCGSANGVGVSNALTEFLSAQNNQKICTAQPTNCVNAQATAGVPSSQRSSSSFGNWGLSNQVPLPIMQALFSGIAASSAFNNSTLMSNVTQNQIGAMFDTLRRSPTYATNRGNNFPLNFFVPQPWANLAGLLDNSGWSYYHGLELEVRRRFTTGVFFQANYTLSKVLTDQRFLTSQSEFQSYRTIADRRQDKNRANFDVTHSFAANYIYELPIGKGKWLLGGANTPLDKLVGGWQIQGLTRWATGAPFTITSNRLTTGAAIGETAVLRNVPVDKLKQFIGTFKTPQGVFWLDPASGLLQLTVTTTGGVTGTASKPVLCSGPTDTKPCFDHPGVNQFGNTPFLGFNGPFFFGQDFSIIKRTRVSKISENFNFDIRFEFFNAFNHAAWANPGTTATANIDNSKFGQLVDLLDTSRGGGVNARTIQWAIRINF